MAEADTDLCPKGRYAAWRIPDLASAQIGRACIGNRHSQQQVMLYLAFIPRPPLHRQCPDPDRSAFNLGW